VGAELFHAEREKDRQRDRLIFVFRDLANACENTVIQGVQKVSVHLMITIQKVTSNVQSGPRQSPDIY
jgi:hypothetical protein